VNTQNVITSGNYIMGRIRLTMLAIYNDRKEIGQVSQKEIAKLWKCSQATVSNVLNGTKGGLTADRIEIFCDIVGITLGDLEKPHESRIKPKELLKYQHGLERLHAKNAKAFRNICRNIDEWLGETTLIEELERGSPVPEKKRRQA